MALKKLLLLNQMHNYTLYRHSLSQKKLATSTFDLWNVLDKFSAEILNNFSSVKKTCLKVSPLNFVPMEFKELQYW